MAALGVWSASKSHFEGFTGALKSWQSLSELADWLYVSTHPPPHNPCSVHCEFLLTSQTPCTFVTLVNSFSVCDPRSTSSLKIQTSDLCVRPAEPESESEDQLHLKTPPTLVITLNMKGWEPLVHLCKCCAASLECLSCISFCPSAFSTIWVSSSATSIMPLLWNILGSTVAYLSISTFVLSIDLFLSLLEHLVVYSEYISVLSTVCFFQSRDCALFILILPSVLHIKWYPPSVCRQEDRMQLVLVSEKTWEVGKYKNWDLVIQRMAQGWELTPF